MKMTMTVTAPAVTSELMYQRPMLVLNRTWM